MISKTFVCMNDGLIFESQVEAAYYYNIAPTYISRCLNHYSKHAFGLYFVRASDFPTDEEPSLFRKKYLQEVMKILNIGDTPLRRCTPQLEKFG